MAQVAVKGLRLMVAKHRQGVLRWDVEEASLFVFLSFCPSRSVKAVLEVAATSPARSLGNAPLFLDGQPPIIGMKSLRMRMTKRRVFSGPPRLN